MGIFKTAHKPGGTEHAHWRILRAEVIAHKYKSHCPNYEPTKPTIPTYNTRGITHVRD